jgi:uncharacterized protein YjiK
LRRSGWVGACALLAAAATCAFFVAGATAAERAAKASEAPIRPAQVLDIERTGVPAPVGIAYAADSGALYVVDGSLGRGSAETDVVTLKPAPRSASDRTGSSRIAAALQDPINMAYDARRSRLLFLGDARQLLEVPVGGSGELDPARLSRHDAGRLGFSSPQGMAVDPASGVVFIVDADVPRIVRVEPQADGGFDEAATSDLDLRPSGIGDVRGLAFDPSTGHLQLRGGESLYELTTAGEVVAVRDLAGFDLVRPEGMVIAPSGDQTDEPSATSVYVADRGGGATQASGQIVELSLAPLATPAAIDFTSALVNTVDMGALSPPSPDPSGITYVPGSGLVVTDAEVEETVNGVTHFQGANVWELSLSGAVQRTANISNVQPTVTPITNEPTGVAFNPSNGHFFVSADDTKKVFDLNPGADGLVGTADDSWTSFNTNALNTDPEGIAYSTFSGTLFVADGSNREVFQYTTGGALLGNFDVEQYGVNDPNSVEFNPDSGTLLVLSDRNSGTGNQRLIVETTTSGALVQTIDVGASNSWRPDGVAYAPASNGTAVKRFYIVDRVLDNNLDPNAVDGKLYEMTAPAPGAPANTPPVVSAGPDQNATLPASANLDGTVSDDGNPNPPGAVTTNWTQVSGPGTITFGNAGMVDTTASTSVPGVYVVRLTASDSELSSFDEATLTFTGSSGVQTLDVSVSAGQDDAEESTANVVLIGNADLDLMTADEANLVVGTRFRSVTIPQGANITSAYLQLTAEEAPHSSPTSLTIRGQAADNPPTFAAVNGDLSGRPTTTASAAWTVDPWLNIGDAGLPQRSSSLTGIVQELVNRPGWVSGNALVLLITGSGTRIAESFNKTATPGGDPLLHVEYTTGNSPPQITSDGGGDTASRSVAENQTAVTTVTAVDPNMGDTLTFSISGGPDAARFQIDSGTGVLTFVTAPNHESPTDVGANNVYDVTVMVSDGAGGTDSQALAVTVLNVNEFPPVITSDGGGANAALSRPENQTAVTTVTATDGDADVLTFSISGGDDAAKFAINASSGVLTFVSAPDFENPTDVGGNNVYEVIVSASDGSLSDAQAIAVTVTNVNEGTLAPPPADFDGNGTTDISLFRPSTGRWYIRNGATVAFGLNGDIPVPGDYDGNGTTDIAVFRPSTGRWYIRNQTTVAFGLNGDIPVPGDYDGNGSTDIAVFRPSTARWYVRNGATVAFGLNGDIPVPGDYDGNGTTDIAVFRPSTARWYVRNQTTVAYGLSSDIPVPGDYDGNGSTDIAVFRPSTARWYIRYQTTVAFGLNGDVPQPGDYDGNGTTYIAVFRPSSARWYIRNQTTVAFGLSSDIPLPLPWAIYDRFF